MLDVGVDLALRSLGGALVPVLYVEREAFAAAHLAWAMEAGRLPPAPVWSDARSVCGPDCGPAVERALAGHRLGMVLGGHGPGR